MYVCNNTEKKDATQVYHNHITVFSCIHLASCILSAPAPAKVTLATCDKSLAVVTTSQRRLWQGKIGKTNRRSSCNCDVQVCVKATSKSDKSEPKTFLRKHDIEPRRKLLSHLLGSSPQTIHHWWVVVLYSPLLCMHNKVVRSLLKQLVSGTAPMRKQGGRVIASTSSGQSISWGWPDPTHQLGIKFCCCAHPAPGCPEKQPGWRRQDRSPV